MGGICDGRQLGRGFRFPAGLGHLVFIWDQHLSTLTDISRLMSVSLLHKKKKKKKTFAYLISQVRPRVIKPFKETLVCPLSFSVHHQ